MSSTSSPSAASPSSQKPLFARTAVVGLGTMGSGIAQVFAAGGCQVACFDSERRARESLHDRIRQSLQRMAAMRLVREDQIDPTLRRIRVHTDAPAATSNAQFVLEAVAEDLDVKRRLLSEIAPSLSPDAIVATNTSTLNIARMSAHLPAELRRRMVVAHWFNPPQIVPVVEVVPGPETSPGIVDATVDFMRQLGKTPVRLAREIPGFIVNRVQAAMIREVWSLLDAGLATPQDIDAAVRGSMGFRLAVSGPLEIADFGGLDVWRKVYENLVPQIYSGQELPNVIREKVDAGDLGPKTGKGIYEYPPERLEQARTRRETLMLELARLLRECQEDDAHA